MKWLHILRIIHRDLGFFVVGMTLIYAISGIILNHIDKNDPAFRMDEKIIQFPSNMTEAELTDVWNADHKLPALKRIFRIDDNRLRVFLEGGIGIYTISDGSLCYQTHQKRILIYWINRLHYNRVTGWSLMADLFAGSLIILAISGLFMSKGKKGLAGSGKWYVIIGILIPILFGLLFIRY